MPTSTHSLKPTRHEIFTFFTGRARKQTSHGETLALTCARGCGWHARTHTSRGFSRQSKLKSKTHHHECVMAPRLASSSKLWAKIPGQTAPRRGARASLIGPQTNVNDERGTHTPTHNKNKHTLNQGEQEEGGRSKREEEARGKKKSPPPRDTNTARQAARRGAAPSDVSGALAGLAASASLAQLTLIRALIQQLLAHRPAARAGARQVCHGSCGGA